MLKCSFTYEYLFGNGTQEFWVFSLFPMPLKRDRRCEYQGTILIFVTGDTHMYQNPLNKYVYVNTFFCALKALIRFKAEWRSDCRQKEPTSRTRYAALKRNIYKFYILESRQAVFRVIVSSTSVCHHSHAVLLSVTVVLGRGVTFSQKEGIHTQHLLDSAGGRWWHSRQL